MTDASKSRALVEWIWWATHEGQRFAETLGYAPLPQPVVALLEARLKTITVAGRAVLPADFGGGARRRS